MTIFLYCVCKGRETIPHNMIYCCRCRMQQSGPSPPSSPSRSFLPKLSYWRCVTHAANFLSARRQELPYPVLPCVQREFSSRQESCLESPLIMGRRKPHTPHIDGASHYYQYSLFCSASLVLPRSKT